ncbi:MAG: CHAT domain-containing protein [Microcoleus sp.]|uniref:CHAT domain-containing tetratricopeptide repeat protein n=1 Tax=Microcoleus sp. TaxID=44472 RepID=UPI003C746DB1
MSWTVILALGSGDFENGFSHVTAELKQQGETVAQYLASLPPAPQVEELHRRWKASCVAGQYNRSGSRIKIKSAGTTNISENRPDAIYQGLKQEMNKWLSNDDFYRKIEVELRTEISNRSEFVEIFLECNNSLIWQLPWDVWQFREDYRNSEIIGSSPEYQKVPRQATIGGIPLPSRGRILGVTGNSKGINVKKDKKEIEKYLGICCELKFLEEPTPQEFRNELFDEKGWQVLFYAGHSDSDTNAANGLLYINQELQDNTVTLEDFKEGLKQAIFKGLQLLIFNSCSSLGIAADLVTEGISLPSVIVMRAPIPDFIAQEFVKSLFRYLALKEPLFLAIRKAKNDLLRHEHNFPGASGIPMLCQHPTFEGLKLLELGCDRPIVPTGDIAGNLPNKQSFVLPSHLIRRLAIGLATTASSYILFGPMLAKVANEMGMKNHRTNQPFAAKTYYKLATLIDLNYAAPHYNLSILCDELNDDKCALDAMQNAVWLGLPDASAQISKLFILKDKHQAALKAIAICLENTKHDGVKATCFKNRGWVRLTQKRYDAAEADLKIAIKFRDDSPEAQCLLAQVLEIKGKPQAALEAWNKALQYSNYRIPKQDECIQIAHQRLQAKGNIK